MSKLTLRGAIMMHYADMLSMYCTDGSCSDCPFNTSIDSCLLSDRGPADWVKYFNKIRKEAADGTQEDNR